MPQKRKKELIWIPRGGMAMHDGTDHRGSAKPVEDEPQFWSQFRISKAPLQLARSPKLPLNNSARSASFFQVLRSSPGITRHPAAGKGDRPAPKCLPNQRPRPRPRRHQQIKRQTLCIHKPSMRENSKSRQPCFCVGLGCMSEDGEDDESREPESRCWLLVAPTLTENTGP